MRIIVIVGSTKEVAREKLEKGIKEGIMRHDDYDEVVLDGCRVMAIGGSEEDVCWLRGVGFDGVEIVTVDEEGISEAMWKRIRLVWSTNNKRKDVDDDT